MPQKLLTFAIFVLLDFSHLVDRYSLTRANFGVLCGLFGKGELSVAIHRQKPTQNLLFKLSLFENLNLELLYVYDTFGSALSAKQWKMLQFRIIHQLNSRVFPAHRTLYPLIHIPYSPLMKKYGSYV